MNTKPYPPTIRLTELVDAVGAARVRELAAQISALEIAPKANQVWRMVLDGAIIIGYTTSVVVAGRDELTMRRAAVLLTIAGDLADDALRQQARAIDLALTARTLADARQDDTYLSRVVNLLDHFNDADDAIQHATMQLLGIHAPQAAAWLWLVSNIYGLGFDLGYQTALVEDAGTEDDHWLPEIPAASAQTTLSA